MTYLINQYPKLEAIFNDGRIELDNNLIENPIGPMAIGRKNYLFCGSHKAAQNAAMIYFSLEVVKCKTSILEYGLKTYLKKYKSTTSKNKKNYSLDIKTK
jgi:uncharacterized protein (DUF169 family)